MYFENSELKNIYIWTRLFKLPKNGHFGTFYKIFYIYTTFSHIR